MKRWKAAGMVLCLGAILALTTGACGSSDGDTTTPPTTPETDLAAIFSGTYCLTGFTGDAGVPDEATATWGNIISNGAGLVNGGMTFDNENGTPGGPNPVTPPDLDYIVDADFHLSITINHHPFLFGGISSDGLVAALATVANTPGIFVLGRKSGTFNDADLNGTYHLCAFIYNQGVLEDRSRWGMANFNGAGGGMTVGVMGNNQGAIAGFLNAPLTYNVNADGSMTGTFFTRPVEGQILAGGELITLAGATLAGHVPIILFLIREGSGLSAATFTGTYDSVSIEADTAAPPDTWLSTVLRVDPDGVGMMGFGAFTSNADQIVTTFPPFIPPVAYTVAANGVLTIAPLGLQGAVAPSGRFAMLAGGTGPGDDPQIWFMVR